MKEQEQIDWLKRTVAAQGAEIEHLKRVLGMTSVVMSEPPSNPFCGQCGMQMYDGAQCGNEASDCPMGVGIELTK